MRAARNAAARALRALRGGGAILALALLPVGGCNLIFPYEAAPASDQGSTEGVVRDRDTRREVPGPPSLHVTSAHDTCASPATIDLVSLTASHPVSFTMDTSGAKADYQFFLPCPNHPDVVIRFTNSPGTLLFCCSGGGDTCAAYNSVPSGPCPPPSGDTVGWVGLSCSGSCSPMFSSPKGDFYLVLGRTSSAGTASIRIEAP